MNNDERIEFLIYSIIHGKTQNNLDGFQKLLNSNIITKQISAEAIAKVAENIGDLYQNGDIFLPYILITADIMKHIMKILKYISIL
ncbi:MAG: B12-binding domain-containing protein [Candidatus Thorarchaeota archaeon]